MANKKVVVDPVTRIEGHLRMQAVLDENNVIVDAMSTGTMWRGLEVCLPFARLKTLSESRFRRTPTSSAT